MARSKEVEDYLARVEAAAKSREPIASERWVGRATISKPRGFDQMTDGQQARAVKRALSAHLKAGGRIKQFRVYDGKNAKSRSDV
jgi:hypothetical protein